MALSTLTITLGAVRRFALHVRELIMAHTHRVLVCSAPEFDELVAELYIKRAVRWTD